MCTVEFFIPLYIVRGTNLYRGIILPNLRIVHWCERGGGPLSLVNTCGEIDVCTPCTEATPSAEGEYPLWVGSGGPPAKGGVVALCEW